MHMLQRLPLENFFFVLPCNRLGVINLTLKKKHLGTGGGQLGLRRDQGGCSGLLAPFRLSEPRLEGSSPACSLGRYELQLQVVPAHKIRASLGHAAIDILLSPGLARPDGILR